MYVSLLGISGALYLGIFEQPARKGFFRKLLTAEGAEQRDKKTAIIDRIGFNRERRAFCLHISMT
jgi:hypothetical protein